MFTKLTDEKIRRQLKRTNDVIEDVIGTRPALYRPPYGAVNKKVRRISKEQGLAILMWNFDSDDWRSRSPKKIFKKVKKNAADGEVVLLHDLRRPTTNAMKKLIPWLTKKGYQLVTVSELMYYKNIEIKAGESYNGAISRIH
jgi:peptidoglycan/xylan/chitin deacetylase (PgdA/CDA1 family)